MRVIFALAIIRQGTLNKIIWTEKKMVRRIATTSKVLGALGLLKEEKFTFQRKIQELVTWHKIPKNLIINIGQAPLSYITVGNTTLEFSGAQLVHVKEKEKEKKSLMCLVWLLQVTFCPCSSITPGGLNAAILKVSHSQRDWTWHTQKTIGTTNTWLSSTLKTSSCHTLKRCMKT